MWVQSPKEEEGGGRVKTSPWSGEQIKIEQRGTIS